MVRYALIFVIVVFVYLIINAIVRKRPIPIWAWVLFGAVLLYLAAVVGYILTNQ